MILENDIDYILINVPKLKQYFQQEYYLGYMLGRSEVFFDFTQAYQHLDAEYKNLQEIPELVEIYNLSDNRIIGYQVIREAF